ncbi:SDR family NAD(P)-dependent oxidoreductase [Hoyosella altamirensis]|uniref:NAD(P)-dependent dehydrogenase (Short-subunit alcohol dehydrogenase family) n=1 Tax=Hoyosella altamirensis TaxID=616997 RepID=A0A839RJD9_9ACTN|nr:SDR family NAD(P)-dependent oxidoreductase [Hoyosella altamirensis]MBB3036570.1 NAD(P)-dependent dehydrogenase (short-subunit alcohol dehydrogenase family) [Hoyosella altamirensis]
MIELHNKAALITGGASGIGAAIARRLASHGARIAVADLDSAKGEQVAAEVGGLFVRTDVSNQSDYARAFEVAGHIDIVVLNAGVGGFGNLTESFDADSYHRLRAINFDGVVFGIQAARQHFAEHGGGTIIVTSSLAGLFESPLDPLYAATKHAVIGLVRSMGPVLAPEDITINALCPTVIDTPIFPREVLDAIRAAGIAVLDAEKVADTVDAILASDSTGQAWPVLPHQLPAPFAFPELPELMTNRTEVMS